MMRETSWAPTWVLGPSSGQDSWGPAHHTPMLAGKDSGYTQKQQPENQSHGRHQRPRWLSPRWDIFPGRWHLSWKLRRRRSPGRGQIGGRGRRPPAGRPGAGTELAVGTGGTGRRARSWQALPTPGLEGQAAAFIEVHLGPSRVLCRRYPDVLLAVR